LIVWRLWGPGSCCFHCCNSQKLTR
jgi:hypothetical protein